MTSHTGYHDYPDYDGTRHAPERSVNIAAGRLWATGATTAIVVGVHLNVALARFS